MSDSPDLATGDWSPLTNERPSPRSRSPYSRGLRGWIGNSRTKKTVVILAIVFLCAQLVAVVQIGLTEGVVNPSSTAFMRADPHGFIYQWVDGDNISRNLLVTIIAKEDTQFPDRTGAFAPGDVWDRASLYLSGQPDQGGSTIDQQLAKNMFLGSDRSMFRKAVEGYYATVADLVLDKRRRLEVYANVAEMGPSIYGACAASWYYFGHSPASLSLDESAQLVGLLTNPALHPRAAGGGVKYRHPAPGVLGDRVAKLRGNVATEVRAVKGLRATEVLGFYGNAEDNAGGIKCDTMPAAVQDRLNKERAHPPAKTVAKKPATKKVQPLTAGQAEESAAAGGANIQTVALTDRNVSGTPAAATRADAARYQASHLVRFNYAGRNYLAAPSSGWTQVWTMTTAGGKGVPAHLTGNCSCASEVWGPSLKS